MLTLQSAFGRVQREEDGHGCGASLRKHELVTVILTLNELSRGGTCQIKHATQRHVFRTETCDIRIFSPLHLPQHGPVSHTTRGRRRSSRCRTFLQRFTGGYTASAPQPGSRHGSDWGAAAVGLRLWSCSGVQKRGVTLETRGSFSISWK